MSQSRIRMPLLFLLLSVWASIPVARAEHTRVTNPNAVTLELFGKGMLWSVQYDRALSDDLVAGLGWGGVPVKFANDTDANIRATLIPAYMSYYFFRDQGSPMVTAGVTLVNNTSEVKTLKSNPGGLRFSSSAALPTIGVGYENRGDSGFLFRVNAYGILGDNFVPWFGFTFGYAF